MTAGSNPAPSAYNETVKKRLLFLTIFLSLLISGLFWFGRVDHDFFSYYYAGKKVWEGSVVYRDVYGNKGPVFYWVMAGLYGIFGDRYDWALVVGSGLLDGLAVYLLLKLIDKWIGGKLCGRDGVHKWIYAAGAVIFYKSFSIGQDLGGLYAENVALPLLYLSLLMWEEKKWPVSGILFGLAVMTRQTLVFFGLIYLARGFAALPLMDKIKWATGLLLTGLVVSGWLVFAGVQEHFWEQAVVFNLYNREVMKSMFWQVIGIRMLYEPRIMTAGVLMLLAVWMELKRGDTWRKWFALSLAAATMSAVFSGGVFYFHHFSQSMPLFFYSFRRIWARGKGSWLSEPFLIMTILATGMGYYYYTHSGNTSAVDDLKLKPPKIAEIEESKYLLVVPYHAKLYFDYGKSAPDKYFDQYFLLDYYYRTRSVEEFSRHSETLDRVWQEMTILTVVNDDFDRMLIDDYLKKLAEKYSVTDLETYFAGRVMMRTFRLGMKDAGLDIK